MIQPLLERIVEVLTGEYSADDTSRPKKIDEAGSSGGSATGVLLKGCVDPAALNPEYQKEVGPEALRLASLPCPLPLVGEGLTDSRMSFRLGRTIGDSLSNRSDCPWGVRRS